MTRSASSQHPGYPPTPRREGSCWPVSVLFGWAGQQDEWTVEAGVVHTVRYTERATNIRVTRSKLLICQLLEV